MAAAARPEEVIWRPQPGPQTALLACPVADVFYGGAMGGGKTDGLLGDWLKHAGKYGQHASGVLFRKSYPQLERIEERAREIFAPLGARENRQKHAWHFPNGAVLRFRILEKDKDAEKYQGDAYTWMGFDELTNWASPKPIDKLFARLRSVHGIPCVRRAAGNPGGVGHNWVKARYIDPAPPFHPHQYQPQPEVRPDLWVQAVFIPAKLEDNQILMRGDPEYEARQAVAADSPELFRAWRYGDWDIVAGGMFDDVWRRDKHLLRPFAIPRSWKIDRAFDWGSSHPFSVGWWAESDGTPAKMADGTDRHFPRKSLIRIAEWYGWNGKPNEGTKLTDTEIARGILQREREMELQGRVQVGPADASIFDIENGNSPAAMQALLGVQWERADKSSGSRKQGWAAIRTRLKEALKDRPEDPGLWIFATCVQWIRTVPVLPRHAVKLDDVDSDAEDHIGDETRYRVLAPDRTLRTGTFRT
jgi:hypothetical protein